MGHPTSLPRLGAGTGGVSPQRGLEIVGATYVRSSAIAGIVDRELSGKNEHAGQHCQANDPQSRIHVRSGYFHQK